MATPSSRFFPHVNDLLLDAIFLVDPDGTVVHVNAACEHIFGYQPEQMIGQPLMDFIAPEDRPETLMEVHQVIAGHPRIGFENRYVHQEGHLVDIMWSVSWSEPDQLRIGVARDISQRKQREKTQAATYAISEAVHNTRDLPTFFKEVHQIIASLVPMADFGVVLRHSVAPQFNCVYPIPEEGSGAEKSESAQQYSAVIAHLGQTSMQQTNALQAQSVPSIFLDEAGWVTMPLATQQKILGALVFKSPAVMDYADREKELLHFICAQVAVAVERKQMTSELLRLAQHDELTNLPNRRLFHHRVKAAHAHCMHKHRKMALLFMDIDKFKQVNDLHGHTVGDVLLQELASRLKRSLRQQDRVFRLGGDEFVVLLEEVQGREDGVKVADKIKDAVRQPIHIGSVVLAVRVSLGIAVYPEDGHEVEQLLRHADEQMYLDKK